MKKTLAAGLATGIASYIWFTKKSQTPEIKHVVPRGMDDRPEDIICPDCGVNFGPPGVLTANKLRAMADWMGQAMEVLEVAAREPLEFHDEEALASFMEMIDCSAMAAEMEYWADIMDEDGDPTDW